MLEDDVAPHHHPLPVLVPEQVVKAADVPHVNAADADLRGQVLRGPAAQSGGFVATDVEPRERQERQFLRIDVVQELVRLFLDRREDVARLPGGGELGMSEDGPEMAERLLVAQDVHPQRLGVAHQRGQLAGSSEPSLGPMVGCFRKANWYSM